MLDWLATPLTESPPADLLRLVAVPVFGWAAYRDIRTRRVPNRTWLPLALLGVVLLAWEINAVLSGSVVGGVAARERFLVRVGLSLGMVGTLGYLFYWFGGFGGADAKALIVLAVLFPTFPTYIFPATALPLTRTTVGVFSLTVLTNTVLVGVAFPVAVAVRNAAAGHTGTAMFLGKPVDVSDVPREYGSLLQTPEGFTRRGLDLDALRMYLRWRGCSLADLRADPATYRDPASLPDDPNPPGDGAVDPEAATDGGVPSEGAAERSPPEGGAGDRLPDGGAEDPWGAQAFLDDVEGGAYGTTTETLRDGLEVLVDEDVVWVSPGMPFIVPMFVGLLVSLVYGDVLVSLIALVT
ncbi:MAG: A24 family peptidase C-terminal domain-containing protein [Haloarculaceae archaeon]